MCAFPSVFHPKPSFKIQVCKAKNCYLHTYHEHSNRELLIWIFQGKKMCLISLNGPQHSFYSFLFEELAALLQ